MRSRSAFPNFVSRYKDPNKINFVEEAKRKNNLADLIDDIYENAILIRQKYTPLGQSAKRDRDGNSTNKDAQELVATWDNYVHVMKKLGAPDQVTGAASNHVKKGEDLPHDYWIDGEKCSRGDCVKVQVSSVNIGDEMEGITTSHDGNEEEESGHPVKSIKPDPDLAAGDPGVQAVQTADAAQNTAASSNPSEQPAASSSPSEQSAASSSPSEQQAASPSSSAKPAAPSGASEKPAASSNPSEQQAASSNSSAKPAAPSGASEKPAASSSASKKPAAADPKPVSSTDHDASPGFSGRDDGTVRFNSPYAPITAPPGGEADSTLHYWKELGGERHHIALGIHSERVGNATLTLYNLVARSSLLKKDEFEKTFKTEQNKFVFGSSERLTSNFGDLPIVAVARVPVNCMDADRVYDPKKCFVGAQFDSNVFWYATKGLELRYTQATIADFYSQCWSFYSPNAITKDEYFEEQIASLETPIPRPTTPTVTKPAAASTKPNHAIAPSKKSHQAEEASQGVPAQNADSSADMNYSDEQLKQLQEYVTWAIAAREKQRKLDNEKGQTS
ncbi:hypothetical protein M409DRAFT_31011 [Zasmidium cellare ATCC 36951]|uniref:Uncharacterized protein n=1 Tax=Zasmidium cellare ATCC 36951 TaxID=1080233 RepID=A0A6A6BWQ9_ZASCE|nr:uncharacterized protein M409DRAFT_31011 [Zasmidium cellare ATCC 36951]KAF2158478.1 hypothetical protein M409DRAFT_31011 [Zasmidium cellare ATCC 36951]